MNITARWHLGMNSRAVLTASLVAHAADVIWAADLSGGQLLRNCFEVSGKQAMHSRRQRIKNRMILTWAGNFQK